MYAGERLVMASQSNGSATKQSVQDIKFPELKHGLSGISNKVVLVLTAMLAACLGGVRRSE